MDEISDLERCCYRFYALKKSLAKIESNLAELHDWLDDDLFPRNPPLEEMQKLRRIDQELAQEINSIADEIDHVKYFCDSPILTLMSGRRLSREEYYLLVAHGVFHIPSKTGLGEAYDDYMHFFYEDDEQKGYIVPSNHPPPEPVENEDGSWTIGLRLRIGIVPEDVRRSCLRDEQDKFFKNFLPTLYSRFRQD